MKQRFRNEFIGAELGDGRRGGRLVELAMALGTYPGESLPQLLGDGAALEAGYRFFGNEGVSAGDVLAPHVRETASRSRERPTVVVAHDTTSFVFPGEKRRGLGRINSGKENGFFAHVALAVSFDEWREPLGTLHLETWTRDQAIKSANLKNPRDRQSDPDRESKRWKRGVDAVEATLEPLLAVHVMDREADDYELLAQLVHERRRFVLRSNFDRKVIEGGLLTEAVASHAVTVTREIAVSERRGSLLPKTRKVHPPRTARMARLGIKAGPVSIARPRDLANDQLPRSLVIHVVCVDEVDPPAGEDAISWRLFTTEPVDTPDQIERVVDMYRCRWRIEEFFKALKTGCAIEKRQLESYHSLQNALAVFLPIAWRLLRLRTLAHADKDRPAASILSDIQIRILRRCSASKLPLDLSVADAFAAIAAVGGHLKRNGSPGWITLARGYERLLTLEEGALIAQEM